MENRVKQTIPILGINTAEPCHTVADGAMEDIYNMHFDNGSFVNVCQPRLLHPIVEDNGYHIVHKMECLAHNEYIAIIGRELFVVEITDGVVSGKGAFGNAGGTESLRLFHFGNVLYVNWGVGIDLCEKCYQYKDSQFIEFDINSIQPVDFTVHRSIGTSAIGSGGIGGTRGGKRDVVLKVIREGLNETKEFYYNVPKAKLTEKGFVVGSFFLMAVYVMFDGTIIKPSEIRFISAEDEDMNYSQNGDSSGCFGLAISYDATPAHVITYSSNINGVKATVTINNVLQKSDMIKSVCLFATRAISQFDYDRIHEEFIPEYADSGFSYCYASRIFNKDAISIDQPFYEVARIDLGEKMVAEIGYKELENAEHMDVYKASFSSHITSSHGKYDYNNRLHYFGIKTQLFKGYRHNLSDRFNDGSRPVEDKIGEGLLLIRYRLKINDKYNTADVISSIDIILYNNSKLAVIPNLLTYPDARVVDVEVVIANNVGSIRYIKTAISVKNSPANNLSYVHLFTDYRSNNHNRAGYIELTLPDSHSLGSITAYERSASIYYSPNKLHVSALNNPFYVSPANIYTIGDSAGEINAINTSTEQITETKFGMYPLYVFTNKAITAMEVGGGEILYSRIIDVSNEAKLPDTTTVGASNLVFFISARGVMAVEGRRVECISEPLESYVGGQWLDFRLYCTHARLSYNYIDSELLVYNSSYQYAYVYNLKSKYWSRRGWSGREIGFQTELMIDDVGVVLPNTQDRDKPLRECSLVSRAIKLGSLEFKRLETLVARLSKDNKSHYHLYIDGSNDLKSWMQIAEGSDQALLRRTKASFKYFRVRLECFVDGYLSLTNFDVEYYLRFVNKLR